MTFISHAVLSKVSLAASCLQVIGYAIQSAAPPFPLFVITFAINGVALGIHIAQSNGYVAALNDHTKMGVLHASYGKLDSVSLAVLVISRMLTGQ